MSDRRPLPDGYDGSEIAVCGMAGRFPGAPDLAAFWANIANGVDSVRSLRDEDLRRTGEDPARLRDRRYVKARPVLEGVDLFDAAFFGFTPREAEILDPQARLFLESCWEALENAGYDTERFPGSIGLFAGASFSNYLAQNLYHNRPVMEAFGDMQATIFNVQDSLVTLAGYKLDLKGPCCAVQTFCSTSLVAVHYASQSLLSYECDLALAGGVTVQLPSESGYLYEEGGILSPTGRCRSFDARADGTVFGSGVGIVVLKRLAEALEQNDTIHAVLRGSAVNNDGARKVSYAAPGLVGQTSVVVEALSAAGADPATIGLVEAHGTGTRLGDPIEVAALTRAFRTKTDKRGFCALGTVKSNVGHLDAAAGVAGLIKMVHALKHRQLPPSVHFETPNPEIDFESSPFYVNTTLREWKANGGRRRGGVSAFGVGGTNAHVVVEEAPPAAATQATRTPQLLVLSAKTPAALEGMTRRLAVHLEKSPLVALSDVAYTLQVGRRAFAYRRAWVAESVDEAWRALERSEGLEPATATESRRPPVVFVIPEATPSAEVVRELHESAPAYRSAFEECRGTASRVALDPGAALLASFAVPYALGRLWMSWGVRPAGFRGEGIGAIVAECLAGSISLEAALRRVSERPEGTKAEAIEGSIELVLSVPEAPKGRSATRLLEQLGRLWMAGVEVDWTALHGDSPSRRIPLPTYPFERERFWIDPAPPEVAAAAAEKMKASQPEKWLYRPVWKTSLPAIPAAAALGARHLFFVDASGIGTRTAEALRALGHSVTTVVVGTAFGGNAESGYSLRPEAKEDYRALIRDLAGRGALPDAVTHFWSVDPLAGAAAGRDRFQAACARGFWSVLHLAQALGEARGRGVVRLDVVGTERCEVLGGEPLVAEKAPLETLLKVIAQEYHDLRCRSIDLDAREVAAHEVSIDRLVEELTTPGGETVLAHRQGQRWIPGFDPLPASFRSQGPGRIRPRGVYLIAGGLGDVGYALGAWLAASAQARLVLVGRRGLPPREEWDGLLAREGAESPVGMRIRKARALERFGAELLILEADVADPTALRGALDAARDHFGALHGVIHAAGVLDATAFRPVQELTPEVCAAQFRAKVDGLYALDEELGDAALDFRLVTSSLSTVLGGIGYGAYAPANAFMDAFAYEKNRQGRSWVSIDWDQWHFGTAGDRRGFAQDAEGGFLPEEGMSVLDRVLKMPERLSRIVVSTIPLGPRLDTWVTPRRPEAATDTAVAPSPSRPRPSLGTAYVAPRNAHERAIGAIWQELLGLERVGVHDDFFELGGHSLFAARVLSRLRSAFGVSLSLDAAFSAPTIAALAGRIVAAEWAQSPGASAETSPRTGEDHVEIEL